MERYVVPMLLIVAFVGQSPSAPDITVRIQESDVVVIVSPRDRRAITAVIVQPHPTRESSQMPKALKPRTRKAVPNGSVMATFDRPPTTFHVIVTLDDHSQHRVDQQKSIYTVTPFKGDVPPKDKPPKGCL
jgi:hypothetical protein